MAACLVAVGSVSLNWFSSSAALCCSESEVLLARTEQGEGDPAPLHLRLVQEPGWEGLAVVSGPPPPHPCSAGPASCLCSSWCLHKGRALPCEAGWRRWEGCGPGEPLPLARCPRCSCQRDTRQEAEPDWARTAPLAVPPTAGGKTEAPRGPRVPGRSGARHRAQCGVELVLSLVLPFNRESFGKLSSGAPAVSPGPCGSPVGSVRQLWKPVPEVSSEGHV